MVLTGLKRLLKTGTALPNPYSLARFAIMLLNDGTFTHRDGIQKLAPMGAWYWILDAEVLEPQPVALDKVDNETPLDSFL